MTEVEAEPAAHAGRGGAASVFVDARSAASSRLTGWERYAREVVALLARFPEVGIRMTDPSSAARRVRADLVDIPRAGRRFDLRHHLTFPPLMGSRDPQTIMTLHDLTWWKYPETASFAGRHYYRRIAEHAATHGSVVTVADATAREIEEHFGIPEVHVVSPVVHIENLVDVAPASRERPYLLFVGSVEPRKNLPALARAFARSTLRHDVDLVIAGRQAWGRLPAGTVHVDAPADHELRSLVKGAMALVLPSLDEGFGLPVVEAQALGTPVLCSDLPVLREVSGGLAHTFDPTDEDSMTAQLDALPSRTHDAEAGMRNSARYSASRTTAQLRRLYRSFGLEVAL